MIIITMESEGVGGANQFNPGRGFPRAPVPGWYDALSATMKRNKSPVCRWCCQVGGKLNAIE